MQAAYRAWWQPVLDHPLDDPEQEKPQLFWPNNIRAQLPWPGAWISCYRWADRMGVGTGGRKGASTDLLKRLEPEIPSILEELPPGFVYRKSIGSDDMTIACLRSADDFQDDDARRKWFGDMLNACVNAIRPRVARLTQRT